jgi:hypothetical protein
MAEKETLSENWIRIFLVRILFRHANVAVKCVDSLEYL